MDGQEPPATGKATWRSRYHAKHRWVRLESLPPGIPPPRTVRIYRRGSNFILSWWDPGLRKNQSERIDGDLLAALLRARQIDERIETLRSAGVRPVRRLGLADLADRFLQDAARRADAGEIDPRTVERYRSALSHFKTFAAQDIVARKYSAAGSVDRDFRLAFDAFLSRERVTSNGRLRGTFRPLRDPGFIRDTVRAMFGWASDPDRGRLLPGEFRNPFLKSARERSARATDPLADPDITTTMAKDMIAACDEFQLRLLAPILLFGLRAAEPCFLFAEHFADGWLGVPCIPELGFLTKGRRDKRFPLLPELRPFWELLRGGRSAGLLYERRTANAPREHARFLGSPLSDLVAEYERRCHVVQNLAAADRSRIRTGLHREAGGLSYDEIQGEFAGLAKRLGWPAAATLKDLRHLFATVTNNASMPDSYRRYLMGHAPGREALSAYTHLNGLANHYAAAVRGEWSELLETILQRTEVLQRTNGDRGSRDPIPRI